MRSPTSSDVGDRQRGLHNVPVDICDCLTNTEGNMAIRLMLTMQQPGAVMVCFS